MIGPLCYIGGKRRIAVKLISLFPKHTTYIEPFCGGAQVFFHKPPSRVEVLNDLDGEIVNFLRVCQLHHEELIRYLRFAVASRRLHELYSRQDPTTLTDIQRAARLLYLQKHSFGGRVTRQNYHYCVTKAPSFTPASLPRLIQATAKRLEQVQLECLPYQEILKKYDRPTTLFYLDPPYVGLELYRFNFSDRDFEELAGRLAGLKGKFLLSINDHPLARKLFGSFFLKEIAIAYTSARSVPTVRELLFGNYELLPDAP